MRRNKILHMISTIGFYGAERVMRDIVRSIAAVGEMEVSVALISDGTEERGLSSTSEAFLENGFEPFHVEGKGKLNISGIMALQKFIKQEGVQLVHSHNYKSDLYALMASFGNDQIKLVATCHNWIDIDRKSSLYGMVDRLALRKFDAVIAVSQSVHDLLLESGVSHRRLHLIENAILPEDSRSSGIRDRQGNATGIISIAFVGRITEEKGVDILLRVCSRISMISPEIRYLLRIVGEGPERSRLERFTQESMPEGTVEWTGFRRDVPAILTDTDIFVLPSRIEASPIVILEAMAAGCAIVSTNVGSIPNRILDGENGILIPPDDEEALEKALRRLAGDSRLRHQLSVRAQEDFARYQSDSNVFGRYASIYRECFRAC